MIENFDYIPAKEDGLIRPIRCDCQAYENWIYGKAPYGGDCPILFDDFESYCRFYGINPHEVPVNVCPDDQQSPPQLLETEVLPPKDKNVLLCLDARTILESVGEIIGESVGKEIRSMAASLVAQEPVQTAPPPEQSHAEPKQPTPKPQDLAEKLMQLERFASHERQLYIFDIQRGFYIPVDGDDTKTVALRCVQEDLRIKGTANQLRDIYEFVRLDPRLKIVSTPPNYLLCFTNGVLNLRDQTFYPGHHPEWFFNWGLAIPYNPASSACPIFDRIIAQISGNDPVLMERIWEIVAYLLIPSDFQKSIVLFQGLGDTGKSLLANVIGRFLYPDLISRVAAKQFGERFTSATLVGKRVNISMDLPGGRLYDDAVSLLKQITGGDTVFVEKKGVDGYSAHLNTRFLFGTNHAFRPASDDEAFLNRIVLIPFRHPVPHEDIIPQEEFIDQLLPERPAIFNKALAAFYRLQANHFKFSGEDQFGIRVAGLGSTGVDPLLTRFIEERCIFDEQAHTPTCAIYAAYSDFRAIHGYPLNDNSQRFSQQFNAATPPRVCLKKIRVSGTPTNCYTGIKIKEA